MRIEWVMLVALLAADTAAAAQAPRAISVRPSAGMEDLGSERRIALVMGNGAYPEAPLRNPVNDAQAMAVALRACGFQVELVTNAGRKRMLEAIRDFGQKLTGGGVGLFYYAGHGMQVKGANYLIPVGTDIATEEDVQAEALDANTVLARMDSAKNRLNLVILDACRNNPFAHAFRGGARGLAQMEAPSGTFIAFATAPGATAADGSGDNGLYTQHLLTALQQPGLKVEEIFKSVRVSVKNASRDLQVPWDSSSLTGDFYFRPGALAPPQAAGPDRSAEAAEELRKGLAIRFGKAGPRNDAEALFRFIQAADLGSAQAMAILGRMYTYGWGTPINPPMALAYFRKAADLGEPLGQNGLGSVYLTGAPAAGIDKDPGRAVLWFQKAADQGFGLAWLNLREAYQHGWGVPVDQGRAMVCHRKAQDLLLKGADAGDVEAMTYLGQTFDTGIEAARDPQLAESWYRKAAELQFPPAMVRLGYLLASGNAGAKDLPAAASWFRKAAEAGDPGGQFQFGSCLFFGNGVPRDEATAALYFRKSAELGFPPAQTSLGFSLFSGRGLPKNVEQGAAWYRKAAEAGYPDGQFRWGSCLFSGLGVPQDDLQAVHFFRLAADQGIASAQTDLGVACMLGRGVPKDEPQAVAWYRKAAEAGEVHAQVNLGICLATAKGVPKNLDQATLWLKKAADQGNETAIQELKKLTPASRY